MSKVLYVDAFSGVSGNMFIGALLDLGVPKDYLAKELEKLNLDEYDLIIENTIKCGISATYFNVLLHEHHHHSHGGHHHSHGGHHHSHEHRSLNDILTIINKSTLADDIKEKSMKVFKVLGEAEAKVHDKPIDEIHFHEVGAIDTIIDIVGTIICLDYLKISEILVSRVCTGFGYVKCAHGTMPVPAPATAELLKNIPYYQGKIEKELSTPTGVALLASLAKVIVDIPSGFTSEKIGYGAGSYDLITPNTLRLFIGSILNKVNNIEKLLIVETNIDDMNPQFYSNVMDRLLDLGVNDVWLTPVIMKKGRPACVITVLLREDLLSDVCKVLFSETSSIGVRYYPVKRNILERQIIKVQLPYGSVLAKVGKLDNNVMNITPEYEDCKALALSLKKPLKKVWQDAMQIALENIKE